jgi:hypothetical protein
MKDVGGEFYFKLFTFNETKQDEGATSQQIAEIDRKLDTLDMEARSSAK